MLRRLALDVLQYHDLLPPPRFGPLGLI